MFNLALLAVFSLALLAKQPSTRPGHHFETPTDNVAPVAVRQNARAPACGLGMPAAPRPCWPSATAHKRAAASAQTGRPSATARTRAAASAQARWGAASLGQRGWFGVGVAAGGLRFFCKVVVCVLLLLLLLFRLTIRRLHLALGRVGQTLHVEEGRGCGQRIPGRYLAANSFFSKAHVCPYADSSSHFSALLACPLRWSMTSW